MKWSPWQPEVSSSNLAVLGKMGEELGELSQMVSRCIIQGINESEPVTGKPNVVSLREEVADVMAMINIVCAHFKLDGSELNARAADKEFYLKEWIDSLDV